MPHTPLTCRGSSSNALGIPWKNHKQGNSLEVVSVVVRLVSCYRVATVGVAAVTAEAVAATMDIL